MSSTVPPRPRAAAPAWRFALGLACGFYPLFTPPAARLGAAALLCGFGILGRLPADRRRSLLAAGLGLALGSLLGLREASLPSWPAAFPEPGAAVPARPLGVVGLAGSLLADSRPAKGGLRVMDLSLERVFVEGGDLSGSCDARGRLRLLVREGPALAAGAAIEARGEWAGEAPGLFFTSRSELIVRGEGQPLARLRNALHEGFIGAIGRVADGGGGRGRDSEGEGRGLLLALLAGWQEELSPSIAGDFRKAGCAHILALSGQHLALIAAALVAVLRPLLGPLRALLPAAAIVSLYTFVVGPGPSLLRALLAFLLAAAASLSDRPQEGRSLLGLCFALHALLLPDQLREAGFVLSYLAVAGLVLLSPRIEYLLLPHLPPLPAAALAASIAAQLFTAPWIALHFGVFQPVGIAATVATGPLVEATMILGLSGAALGGALPAAAALLAPVEGGLLDLLIGAMRAFASLPSLALPSPGGRILLSAAIVLFAAFLYARPHVEARAFRFSAEPGRGPGARGGALSGARHEPGRRPA